MFCKLFAFTILLYPRRVIKHIGAELHLRTKRKDEKWFRIPIIPWFIDITYYPHTFVLAPHPQSGGKSVRLSFVLLLCEALHLGASQPIYSSISRPHFLDSSPILGLTNCYNYCILCYKWKWWIVVILIHLIFSDVEYIFIDL